MRIGNKIKLLRKEHGMSQKALADQAGISCSFLNDIEKERSNPSFEKLQRICSVLHVNSTYFLGSKSKQEDSELYSNILSLVQEIRYWDEEDQLELLHYLRAKSISKK